MQNNQEVVALVPVREGSSRVKNKNFRDFVDGKSLFELKIDQLKKSGCFNHIYVSSDSEKAKEIAQSNKVEFLKRESRMCKGEVNFAELIEHIMTTIPGDPIVAYVLVTSPLFQDFSKAVKKFIEVQKEYDSLVAVLPRKAFFLNKHGRGINYQHGYWHPYSQELETYFEVTGACYIARKSDMLKWKYWFGTKPYLFEVPAITAVDVDTPADFEFAQKIYRVENG